MGSEKVSSEGPVPVAKTRSPPPGEVSPSPVPRETEFALVQGEVVLSAVWALPMGKGLGCLVPLVSVQRSGEFLDPT